MDKLSTKNLKLLLPLTHAANVNECGQEYIGNLNKSNNFITCNNIVTTTITRLESFNIKTF